MSAPRLDFAAASPGDVLIQEARLLDPRAGIDRPADVLIRSGQIAELGEPGTLDGPAGAEVVDSPQALIVQQVESGVVVRMAVLYELLAGRSAPQPGGRELNIAPVPA